MTPAEISRRELLKTSAVSAGAVALGGLAPREVLGANERIRFACIVDPSRSLTTNKSPFSFSAVSTIPATKSTPYVACSSMPRLQ